MVAVFTGSGLGVFDTSISQLGGTSGGSGRLGQSQSRYAINLATGNLVLQDVDETILTRGLPISMLRTYNSQGTVAGQGQDGWMSGFERRVAGLTGTVNTAGSTVTRYLGDGSAVVYTWDAGRSAYVSTAGEGAHDTITWNAGNSRWTWVEGSTLATDVYDASGSNGGRLLQIIDGHSGAQYNLTYTADGPTGLVSTVYSALADGDGLAFAYTDGRLTTLSTREGGVLRAQVVYAYDMLGRLKSVTTDLTPQLDTDNAWSATAAQNDGRLFRTTYTYVSDTDANDLRIARIGHSDGTLLSFSYDGASGRVLKATAGDIDHDDTDGLGQTVEIAYGAVSGGLTPVTVTDSSQRAWTYVFDERNQLVELRSPQVDGLSDVTTYVYDASDNGDVLQIVTSRGAAVLSRVDYQYDARGNRIREWDLAGNRIDRQYDGNNQLVAETRYTAVDPDGTGTQDPAAGTALTTRHVYKSFGRLRYTIDATGLVTQYVYGSSGGENGQVVAMRRFVGAAYTSTTALAEADLDAWAATRLADSERTDYLYNAMGRLQETREFAQLDPSTGAGILNAATRLTVYTYDAQGLLRQQMTQHGVGRGFGVEAQQASQIVDYVYDGMGRLLSTLQRSGATAAMPDPATDPAGHATWLAANDAGTVLSTYAYLDSGNTIRMVSDSGMTRTEVRNAAGVLVSVAEANAPSAPSTTRATERHYDTAGRLIAEQDAAGGRRYFIYDAKGRLSATVDATGAVTQTVYDGADRVLEVRAYANRVTPQASWWTSNTPPTSLWRSDAGGTAPAGALTVTVDATRDVVTQTTYDTAGRIATETVVGADAAQTRRTSYTYDAAHRLLQVSVTDGAGTAGNARTTRYLYDQAGRRIAEIDARGFVTETVYDLAGRVAKTIRYANASTTPAATTLAGVRPITLDPAKDQTTRHFHDGRGNLIATLDAEGYLTEFVYDEALNQRAVKAYERRLTGLGGTESLSTLRTNAVSGLPANTGYRLTQRSFDALGRVQTEVNHEGTVTRYSYDEAGRLVRTESAYGVASEVREGGLRHDAFGQLIGEISGENIVLAMQALTGGKTLDDPTLSASTLDAVYAQYGTTHRYDLLGRRIESIDAQGNKTWMFYDAEGRATFVVRGQRDEANVPNARAEVTETRYDAFGRATDSIAYTGTLVVPVPGDRASVQSLLATLTTVGMYDSRTQMAYDRRGLLIERIDAEGYRTRFAYNAFGEVATQQDLEADGSTVRRTSSWTYDARGQATATGETGGASSRSVATVYDAFGRAIQRTDARGTATTLSYDRLGRTIGQSTVVGGRTEAAALAYDAFGRVVTQTDALGNTTTFAYDDAARTTTVTSPEGVAVTTTHNRHGQTVTVSQPLPGGGTATQTTAYDRSGRVLSTTDALNKTSNNEYDVRGLLAATVDASGRRVEYRYDAAGRVLQRIEDPGAGRLNLTTAYAYDAQGRQIRVTDASGRVVTMTYDRRGHLADTVRDPSGLALRTTYTWDRDGRQLTVTEGAGSVAASTTAYVYDALGRRTQEIRGSGSLNLTTAYVYDANDNVVSATDASGRTTRYAYDAANRLRFTLDAMGGIEEVAYDAAGRTTMTRRYAKTGDISGLPAQPSASDIANLVLAQGYRNDALDEVRYSLYDRDGRLRVSVDGIGGVRESVYDSAGRVAREIAYVRTLALTAAQRDAIRDGTATIPGLNLSTLASANDAVVRHVYDAAGQRRYSVDATGAVSGWWYDAAGRVVATRVHAQRIALSLVTDGITKGQIDTAVGGGAAADAVELFIYDGAGRQRFVLRANGDAGTYPASQSVTETRYDAAGRVLLTQTYLDSLALEIAIAGKISGGNGVESDLAAFVSANAGRVQSERRVYDAAGRLTYSIDATGGTTRTWHDAAGRVTVTRTFATRQTAATLATLSDATTVTQLDGQLVWLSSDQATYQVHDAAGRLRFAYNGAGELREMRYDGAGRALLIRSFTVPFWGDASFNSRLYSGGVTEADFASFIASNAGTAQSERSVYDAAGRLTYSIDATGAFTRIWRDGADRAVGTRLFATRLSPAALAGLNDATTTGALDAQLTWLEWDRANYRIHDAAGRVRFEYNGQGQVREMRYDGAGRALLTRAFTAPFWGDSGLNAKLFAGTATEADFAAFVAANTATAQSQRTVYDAGGNAIFTVDGTGAYARRWYDGVGRQTAQVRFAERMSLMGIDDSATVALLDTRLTWPNENETVYQVHDAAGRLRYSVQMIAPSVAAVSETIHDAADRAVSERRYMQSMAVDAALTSKLLMGQAKEADFAAFTGANQSTAETRRVVHDAAGRARFTIDGLGHVTQSNYDGAGRLQSRHTYGSAIALTPALIAKLDAGTASDADIVAAAGTTAAIAPWSTGFDSPVVPGLDLSQLDPAGNNGARIENGRLVFNRVANSSTTWPVLLSQESYALAEGRTFRTEITTAATQTNNNLLLSLRNTANNFANEGINISNGRLLAYRGTPEGGHSFTDIGALSDSTTYVVEMETTATSITTYVYVKGQGRDSGFRIDRTVTSAAYGSFKFLMHGTSEPGVSGASLYVDNLAILNGNSATSESYRYDAAGRVIAKVDGLGNTEAYAYDAAGRRVSVTDANGRTRRTVYDAAGHPVYDIDATGAFTRIWFDAAGQAVAVRRFDLRFDPATLNATTTAAQLDAQLGPMGAWTAGYRHEYRVYDTAGQLRFVYDGAAYLTHYEYDGAGRVLATRRYASQFLSGDPTLGNRLFAGTAHYGDFAAFIAANEAGARTEAQVYDGAGRVRYVLQNNGGQWTVAERSYDGAGRTAAETRFGVTIAFSPGQSEASVISALQAQLSADPQILATQARTTRYLYDAAGRLRFTLDPSFAVSEQRHDAAGRVLQTLSYGLRPSNISIDTTTVAAWAQSQTAANTRKVGMSYDAAGRLAARTDALGHSETFTYDAAGRMRTRTDRTGAVWTHEYDAAGRKTADISPQVQIHAVSTQGVLSSTTRSVVTRYVYDALGQVTRRIEDADNLAGSRATAYAYDHLGRVVKTTLPHPGNIDPATGNLVHTGPAPTTETVYDALGNAVVEKDVKGGYIHRMFDGDGRVIGEVDQALNVSTYLYNAYGEQTRMIRYAAPLNTATTAAAGWQPGQAMPWAMIVAGVNNSDGSNRFIHTDYDMLGRKTQVRLSVVGYIDAGGALSNGTPTTRYQYNAYGETVLESVLLEGTADTPSARWAETRRWYDPVGRNTFTVDAEGYASAMHYNATGELVRNIEYARALSLSGLTPTLPPAPPAAGDADTGYDRETLLGYDILGRKVTETVVRHYRLTDGSELAHNQTVAFSYDNEDRVVAKTDDTGTTTTTYNALGQVTALREPARATLVSNAGVLLQSLGNDLASAALYVQRSPYTTMAYDAFGRMVAARRHAIGHDGVTPPAIDALNDQVTLTVFDALDRAVMSQDPAGSRSWSAYDHAGNLVHQWTQWANSDGVNADMLHNYVEYDATGRQTRTLIERRSLDGLVLRGVDRDESVQYNAFGEIVAKSYAGIAGSLGYTYDNAGRMVSSNETGGVRSIGYNLAGHQVRSSQKVWIDATTGAIDAVTRMTTDRLGRAVAVIQPSHTASTATTSTVQQTYDRWGNVVRIVDARGYQTDYRYNDHNQLIRETRPLAWVLGENGAGAWQRPVNDWYYDSAGRLIGTRDANGNLRSYGYDAVGRQTSVTDALGNVTRMAYDTLGNERYKQNALGYITWTAYDTRGQASAIGDYLSQGGARTSATLQSFVLNQQGDRLRVTDVLGNTARYDYDGQKRLIHSRTATGVEMRYAYDAAGRKVSETNGLTATAATYLDRDGQTVKQHALSWQYDVYGRMVDHNNLSGRDSDYVYDTLSGMLKEETQSGGVGTQPGLGRKQYTYYANGRVRSIVENGGTSVYTYEYDAAGNRILERSKTVDGQNMALHLEVRTVYDSNNRVQRVVQDALDAGGAFLKRDFDLVYDYDANGNRRRVRSESSYGYNLPGLTVTNEAPDAIATPADRGVRKGETSAFRLLFSDIFRDRENDALTLTITRADGSALPAWLSATRDAQTGEILFTATPAANAADEDLQVRLTAHENATTSNSDSVVFTVKVRANNAPTPRSAQTPTYGAKLNLAFNRTLIAADLFQDIDVGDALSLSVVGGLPAWLTPDASTPGQLRLSGTATVAGSWTFTIRATDTAGATADRQITVQAAVNHVPTVVATPAPQDATIGRNFIWSRPLSAVFSDIDADALRIVATGLPNWLSYQTVDGPNGIELRVSGQVPADAVDGQVFNIQLTATDPYGASASTVLQVASTTNIPPTAPYLANKQAKQGQAFSVQLPAFGDDNGDTLTYSMSNLPAGLSFNAATRTLSGTPTGSGTWSVGYTANDGRVSTTASFSLVVEANNAPVAPSIGTQTSTQNGAVYIVLPAFTDPNGDPLTYTATGLPPGLSFNASARAISGTPTTVGSWTVTYTANDGRGGATSTTFTHTIQAGTPANQAPVASTPIPNRTVNAGQSFSHGLPANAFVDPEGQTLSYSLAGGGGGALPFGNLSINAQTGTVSGTPPLWAAYEMFTLRVIATDPHGASAWSEFRLIVEESGGGGGGQQQSQPAESESLSFDMGMEMYSAQSQSSSSSGPTVREIWYSYDAENRIKVTGGVLSGAVGNAATRIVIAEPNTQNDSFETAYDAAGRAVGIYRRQYMQIGYGTQLSDTVDRTVYDQRGNRLYEYHREILGVSGGNGGVLRKFVYDAANRLTQSYGYYRNGWMVDLGNDQEGEWQGTMDIGGWLQTYEQMSYDADGRLRWQLTRTRDESHWQDYDLWEWRQNSANQSTDVNVLDLDTRVDYSWWNNGQQVWEDPNLDDNPSSYDAAGRMMGYRYTQFSDGGAYTHTFNTTYQGWASYQEIEVKGQSSNHYYKPTTNVLTLDTFGRLTNQSEQTEYDTYIPHRIRAYSYNGDGQVLSRRHGTWNNNAFQLDGGGGGPNDIRQQYGYVYSGGQQVAELRDGGGTRFNIPTHTGVAGTGTYTAGGNMVPVAQGDTLQSLAQRVYGNSSLWYVLADANGLKDPNAPLIAGTQLKAPSVQVNKNDAGTFKPYNPAENIGSTTPSLPYINPPKAGCSTLMMVIIAIIVIVVTIYTAGAAAGAAGAGAGTAGGTGAAVGTGAATTAAGGTAGIAGTAGSAASFAGSLGAGVGGAAAGTGAGAAVAGAAGAAASSSVFATGLAALGGQFGVGIGMLAGAAGGAAGAAIGGALSSMAGVGSFSWRNVAAGAITGGLTAGLGASGAFSRMPAVLAAASSAASSNVISYAANKALGNNASFSWRSVAASAVTAGVTAAAMPALNKRFGFDLTTAGGQAKSDVVRSVFGGVTGMHIRRAFGMNENVDYGVIAGDVISSYIGNQATGQYANQAQSYSDALDADIAKSSVGQSDVGESRLGDGLLLPGRDAQVEVENAPASPASPASPQANGTVSTAPRPVPSGPVRRPSSVSGHGSATRVEEINRRDSKGRVYAEGAAYDQLMAIDEYARGQRDFSGYSTQYVLDTVYPKYYGYANPWAVDSELERISVRGPATSEQRAYWRARYEISKGGGVYFKREIWDRAYNEGYRYQARPRYTQAQLAWRNEPINRAARTLLTPVIGSWFEREDRGLVAWRTPSLGETAGGVGKLGYNVAMPLLELATPLLSIANTLSPGLVPTQLEYTNEELYVVNVAEPVAFLGSMLGGEAVLATRFSRHGGLANKYSDIRQLEAWTNFGVPTAARSAGGRRWSAVADSMSGSGQVAANAVAVSVADNLTSYGTTVSDEIAALQRMRSANTSSEGRIFNSRITLKPYVVSGDVNGLIGQLDVGASERPLGFWSGNLDAAMSEASRANVALLETTPGGQVVNNWAFLNKRWSWQNGGEQFWGGLSSKYASGARGEVFVWQAPDRAITADGLLNWKGGYVWQNYEMPVVTQLQSVGTVGNINYRLVEPTIVNAPLRWH